MLKTLLATAALGLTLLSAPAGAAQGQPASHAAYLLANQPVDAIALQQFVIGTWAIETQVGRSVASYLPDGSISGMVLLRDRPQPVPFQGHWAVRPLGGDRFELTLTVGRQAMGETLRWLADGTIYNESARAVAYRVF